MRDREKIVYGIKEIVHSIYGKKYIYAYIDIHFRLIYQFTSRTYRIHLRVVFSQ